MVGVSETVGTRPRNRPTVAASPSDRGDGPGGRRFDWRKLADFGPKRVRALFHNHFSVIFGVTLGYDHRDGTGLSSGVATENGGGGRLRTGRRDPVR